MTPKAKKRRSATRLWIEGTIGVVLLVAVVLFGKYLRSPSFEDYVRRKVIATLEDATGGRVELAAFHWTLSGLTFVADGLTIHGLEGPDQLPYAHVDRAQIQLHIISFFERRVSLDRVDLQHPVIHVIVYPNGSTNAPEPKVKREANKPPIEELFDLTVGRADLRDGMLLLNERKLPFDFAANDIAATMSYTLLAQRYDGTVRVGKMDAKYADFRDVAAQGDLQFSLWRNNAEIKSLTLQSEKSSLQASGKVTNFERPEIQATYSSTLNLSQLGAVARVYQLRGGTVELNGTGSYSEAAGYASQGRVAFRDVDYVDQGLALRKANLSSDFSLENNNLALTHVAARLLGGQVTGDVDVKNVMPSTPPASATERSVTATKPSPGRSRKRTASPVAAIVNGEQEGTAHLRINGFSIGELARMMSTRSMPLDKLKPAGSVKGTVNLAWKQSLADALADLALDVTAPAHPAADQLPITGNLRGRYSMRSGRVDLSALNLTTPHTQLQATGTLGSTSAALNLGVSVTSLTEFQPLLSAMGNSPLPVELDGSAAFTGTLSGRLRTPQITGHLEATNFSYIYTPGSTAPAPQKTQATAQHKSWFHLTAAPPPAPPPPLPATPRRIHVDQFSADIQYSQSGVALHHAVIQEGTAQLTLDGSAALDKGNFTESSQFQVQAAIHNGDVAELQRVIGTTYPVTGKLNFSLQASGTEGDPRGQGQISLTDGQAYGRPIKTLTSKIMFANHAAELDDIRLQAARGTVAGSAAYDFRNQGVKVDLTGQSIDLAEIPQVQSPRLQVAGVANFTVKASGTLDQPVVNAHVQVANLVLNGDILGSLTADAVTHGTQLQLSARSNFPQASLTLDGNVNLQGDMPGEATLKFSHLDITPFMLTEVRSRVTRHASLDGEAQLSGPFKRPALLNGNLHIREFGVEIDHIALKSDGPVELSFANQVVTVTHCTLTSEDTHFTLTGTASLKDDHRLSLRGTGDLNLKLAQTLDPDLTSYGALNVNLTVDGTAAAPVLSGRVTVAHAGLSRIDLPVGLGDVNGTLLFNKDRLEVEKLTGRMGGGQANLGGFVTFGRPLGFNLTADGHDIRFRYAGISVTSDQTLHLTGTLANALLTGDVTVTRFAQIPSSDLQFVLAQATAPPSIPNLKSPLNNLHLEVRILSTPELTVQTSLAKLSGDVDLRLRGTGARPVLLGRINVAEGDIKLGGQKYHLERGDVTFLDPVRIDPVLDVEATTRVRDYDITIGLHGTLEKLNTTYRSDPPLTSDDIVSLLAFGRTQQENAMGATSSPGFAESASGALLSAAINQTVSNRVSKIFGVSAIRINPSVGGPDNDPNARLTVEQQVSNNVTFTYITNLARSAQEVIQFEYNINSEYTVQGIRDENGVVSFDLLIRKRKR